MKKLLSTLALGTATVTLFLGAPAFAEATEAAPAAAPKAAVKAKPALWKVADEDTTIYLFGTVHILPEGIEWFTGSVSDALAASDVLVTEIPMGPQADAEMQQMAMQKGMLGQGGNLRALLSEEDKAAYEAALAKLSIPAPAFDAFKPWMAGLTLTVIPLLQQGYTLDAGVEKQLMKLAGPEKATGSLETIAFQLGMFDGMPQETQIEFLIAAASTAGDIVPTLDTMVAKWAEGDDAGLAAIMNEEMGDPAVAEALLYSRNANWAEWIDTRLDAPGTVFMAVGAGHLAGERSVQDLLAQRGITTARVQ
ncbi:TraB/GumN family protein [Altererythrobacter sp. H2]|uniref:TraB/GumN family protein n=1 Tax=Altererythrobacter sp. H2 TaxID=3108391 RepID=UPI002B4BCEE4|nr:TraB/GumN family protein [Altererythrobacter sp. H2]WRK94422.1 TraB/GumN family protein [Altererythrobacter sp. H2]